MNWIVGTHWNLGLPDSENNCSRFHLAVAFGQRPAIPPSVTKLSLTCSFADFDLIIETRLIDILGELLFPAWFGDEGRTLPDDWRAILVVEKLASLSGLDVNLLTLKPADATNPSPCGGSTLLYGLVHLEGASYHFNVMVWDIHGSLPGGLRSLHCSEMTNGLDPGFACSVQLSPKRLAPSVYRRLRPGDVILIARKHGGAIPFFARLPGVFTLSGSLSIRISDGPVRSTIQRIRKSIAMIDDPPEAPQEDFQSEEFEQIQPGLLPVTLQVQLGSHRLTIEEIRQLAPGSTLELDIDLNAPVKIMANGISVGLGHLIQIGDRVGVQLVEWPIMKAGWDA
ncbi:FliM/FliN family flagellar motor switch protein [Phyllobacterium salinisoli]|uniref:FliM/FliN family flagellar motor switch protein n=1 Tax=Phyllobacterium salinisoli TaxID=1899321 RepID=UPI001357AD97|nr:FliM/FliN family flagellar motor switch protein [Phyllobacterium salinisoli]